MSVSAVYSFVTTDLRSRIQQGMLSVFIDSGDQKAKKVYEKFMWNEVEDVVPIFEE